MGSDEPRRGASSRGHQVLPVLMAICALLSGRTGAAGNWLTPEPDADAAARSPTPAPDSIGPLPVALDPFFADLEERALRFLWESGNPGNDPTPERYPTPSFASIAAPGFGLTGNSATPAPQAIGVLRDAYPAADASHSVPLDPFFADLEERTFRFFWDTGNPRNGLIPDRYPTPSFASIAAVGFGLTSYPIGVERGYISREAARQRVLATLRFFAGEANQHGFFYHFIDMRSGARSNESEVSTVDTALLLAGMLFCQTYFDGDDPEEIEIRTLAEEIYRRVDWTWERLQRGDARLPARPGLPHAPRR